MHTLPTPSSTVPSQLSSRPLQTSGEGPWKPTQAPHTPATQSLLPILHTPLQIPVETSQPEAAG